ncbi:AMSH/STAMBP protein ubiquitin specific-protease [Malassezia vespertilionis]|uniref:AMSH/STAMBP protein ubiquitin specific-protease n=1 Tax=Malassezia vespertilionis TaxID=2020962 RepID=UPI0024B20A25|nr:AMSH/STAMBP protein ubiquitin specific-protease [Malassezia vespertilionis]WFD05438.1 AMSH/STAMBP protein ubiquitin specific-protease [Malassezia vespertilionis]
MADTAASPAPGPTSHGPGSSDTTGPAAVQYNEQWMMHLNRDGLPVCRDLHGLFTTMIISISDRWPDWRYQLAFVLAAAVQRMQALQFVQIVRDSVGGMHNMLSLSQTKTSFIMNSDTAWQICNAFVNAHLLQKIPHADGDVYSPTPKGLHLVDRFVTRHGIATRSVSNLLNIHEVCDKLVLMERDDQDDIILSDGVVRIVYHRMVGLSPYRDESSSLGVILRRSFAFEQGGQAYETSSFTSEHALAWLLNYTTLVNVDEAAALIAHMIRLGWIEPENVMAPSKSPRVVTVRVDAELRPEGTAEEGTFVQGEDYHITELGATVAWHVDWDNPIITSDNEPRPPTSMSDAQRGHETRFVSPRLDEFELYNAYTNASASPLRKGRSEGFTPLAAFSPFPNFTSLIDTPKLGETETHGASTRTDQEYAAQCPEPAPSDEQKPISLHDILQTPSLRVAFGGFLTSVNKHILLKSWCTLEWFRYDCRLASCGALSQITRGDPIETLFSAPLPENGKPAMSAPMMRAVQRPLLEESARVHIGPFLTTNHHAPVVQLSTLERLSEAYATYTQTAHPMPAIEPDTESARESESQLAQLLVQSAAAQKELYHGLQGPKKAFIAARAESAK